MAGDCSDDSDEVAGTGGVRPATPPPEKRGLSFYAALGLIGLLVLMVAVLNYPADRVNAGIVMTQTNWTLKFLMDKTGIFIPAMSGTEVSARFDREGRVSGNAGCNRYSATYRIRDTNITISGISYTEMLCRDPGVMDQESAFIADLRKTSSFRFSGASLTFSDDAGKTVLVFIPA